MRLYMITDRQLFASVGSGDSGYFLDNVSRWVSAGLDFVQVREKDLSSSDLEQLTFHLRQDTSKLASTRGISAPAVLLNVRNNQQVKIACRVADGVHLPGDAGSLTKRVEQARALWSSERRDNPEAGPDPLVSVSCHTISEVEEAGSAQVSVILFAPIFEKPLRGEPPISGVGLAALRAACLAAGPVPVFALGGVTLGNADECLTAGAAGVAGIRFFTEVPPRELPER